MLLQLLIVLIAIIIGARLGGIGLGVMGGVGLAFLIFVFGLQPTAPPIDVMLMIVAVISAASCMQAAGGLDYMVKLAETGRKGSAQESFACHYPESDCYLSLYIYCRDRACGLFRSSCDCRSGA